MKARANDIENVAVDAPRYRWFGAIFALLSCLGLAFATSLEALRPLCGGRQATISSNDARIQGTKAPDVIVGGPAQRDLGGRRQ